MPVIASTGSPSQRRVLLSVALFWLATFGILIGTGLFRFLAPPPVSALAWGIASTIALLALSAAFLRWEGRDAQSAGLHFQSSSLVRFAIGAAIGVGLYLLHLAVVLGLTDARLAPSATASISGVGLAIVTYIALSMMEELGFRGYALRRLEERLGRVAALVIGAAVFASLHLAYGWTLSGALVGAGAGGLLFGIAALASRGLAVPIGLHAAWNVVGWSVGEKATNGLWQLVAPATTMRASIVGSTSYLLVFAIGIVGFWQYGRAREKSGD